MGEDRRRIGCTFRSIISSPAEGRVGGRTRCMEEDEEEEEGEEEEEEVEENKMKLGNCV